VTAFLPISESSPLTPLFFLHNSASLGRLLPQLIYIVHRIMEMDIKYLRYKNWKRTYDSVHT
jgi:hypothetical protein